MASKSPSNVLDSDPAASTSRGHVPDGLPAYSDVPTAIQAAPTPSILPAFPTIDFAKYDIPESTVSADGTTTTTTLARLSSQPAALEAFLREQAALPPKPHVRICGKNPSSGAVDFDLRLNMMACFVGGQADAGRLNYVKVVDDGERAYRGGASEATKPTAKGGLREWTQRFCADSVRLKTFTLRRVIVNWNTDYLEGQIRSLIAALKYNGQVTVGFPVARSAVVVAVASSGTFLSMLSLLLEKKKYEVVKSVWPYATTAPSDDPHVARQFAVQSEVQWWSEWKPAITHALLCRRVGWVSVEDRIEAAMGPTKGQPGWQTTMACS